MSSNEIDLGVKVCVNRLSSKRSTTRTQAPFMMLTILGCGLAAAGIGGGVGEK